MNAIMISFGRRQSVASMFPKYSVKNITAASLDAQR